MVCWGQGKLITRKRSISVFGLHIHIRRMRNTETTRNDNKLLRDFPIFYRFFTEKSRSIIANNLESRGY